MSNYNKELIKTLAFSLVGVCGLWLGIVIAFQL